LRCEGVENNQELVEAMSDERPLPFPPPGVGHQNGQMEPPRVRRGERRLARMRQWRLAAPRRFVGCLSRAPKSFFWLKSARLCGSGCWHRGRDRSIGTCPSVLRGPAVGHGGVRRPERV